LRKWLKNRGGYARRKERKPGLSCEESMNGMAVSTLTRASFQMEIDFQERE